MCSDVVLHAIIAEIARAYRTAYGTALRHIYLYGSYARGDFETDSDIDLVAIVEGERGELQRKLKEIWNISAELELEYDVIISPTVIPAAEFAAYDGVLPYYANIAKEGVEIGA